MYKMLICYTSPWEPPCPLEELDLLGFMIDSGLKLSHEQHEPHWQNCSLEHFALISANWALIAISANLASF